VIHVVLTLLKVVDFILDFRYIFLYVNNVFFYDDNIFFYVNNIFYENELKTVIYWCGRLPYFTVSYQKRSHHDAQE